MGSDALARKKHAGAACSLISPVTHAPHGLRIDVHPSPELPRALLIALGRHDAGRAGSRWLLLLHGDGLFIGWPHTTMSRTPPAPLTLRAALAPVGKFRDALDAA